MRLTVSMAATCAAWALAASGAAAGTLDVLVLDRDGKPTPDAVVIVTPSGKGQPKTPLLNSAVVNQEKQQFVPTVTVVAVGARVRFINSDPWNHHVRVGAAGAAVGASDGQSAVLEGKQDGKPASAAVFTMDKPGAMGAALLGCFIHSRMGGAIYVAESPWTVKTNAEGVAVPAQCTASPTHTNAQTPLATISALSMRGVRVRRMASDNE